MDRGSVLGAHALLRRDLETAEERLEFAVDVFGGVDVEALSRLAVVHGLQGRFEEARAELEGVRDMASFTPPHGPPTVQELRERAFNFLTPFVDEPGLATGERGIRTCEEFAGVFERSIGPLDELMERLQESHQDK